MFPVASSLTFASHLQIEIIPNPDSQSLFQSTDFWCHYEIRRRNSYTSPGRTIHVHVAHQSASYILEILPLSCITFALLCASLQPGYRRWIKHLSETACSSPYVAVAALTICSQLPQRLLAEKIYQVLISICLVSLPLYLRSRIKFPDIGLPLKSISTQYETYFLSSKTWPWHNHGFALLY